MAKPPVLGVMAGGGDMPGRVIEACKAEGRAVFVVALKGYADSPLIETVPHAEVRLGAMATWLKHMREAGVEELLLCGLLRRPRLKDIRPDMRGAKFLAKGALSLGDDGLLKAGIRELEKEGFRVVGLDSVLSNLVTVKGLYGKRKPGKQAKADIVIGIEAAKVLGAIDVGQGVVVEDGVVLAAEAAEGTEAMLGRIKPLRRKDGRGGVLVKVCKPGQEKRADLPAIGVATVEQAAAAGLEGIAIEAGKSLVIDREAVIAKANALKLFIIGVEAEEGQ